MTALERYSPAIAVFHAALALMAAHFAFVVWWGGSPITPELYGPAVYNFPALAWCGVQFLGAAVAAFGACSRRPIVMAIGACLSAVVYSGFAAMAAGAAQGTIVQAASMWVGMPLSVASAGIGIWGRGNNA